MKTKARHSRLAILMNFREGNLLDPLEAAACGSLGASVADLFQEDTRPSGAKRKPAKDEDEEEADADDDEDEEEEDEEEEEEEEAEAEEEEEGLEDEEE